jgi:hypothetical protein
MGVTTALCVGAGLGIVAAVAAVYFEIRAFL